MFARTRRNFNPVDKHSNSHLYSILSQTLASIRRSPSKLSHGNVLPQSADLQMWQSHHV